MPNSATPTVPTEAAQPGAAPGEGMLTELRRLLASFPDKIPFVLVTAAWTALFHWLGNATQGYVKSSSAFDWAMALYHNGQLTDTDDQLGVIAPFFVLGIFVYRRAELTTVAKRAWSGGAALVVAGLLLHLAGFMIQQTRLSIAGFLIGVYGIMGVFWGRAWLKAVAFPYCLLVFCIPLSAYLYPLTFKLQLFSTWASAGAAKALLNMPLERVGAIVTHAATKDYPAFSFTVAAACSGMRSSTVTLLVVTSFAFLFLRSRRARVLIIAASPFLAVAANILRLFITFVVADAGGEAAGAKIESNTGFLTFPIALGSVFLLARLLPDARWAGTSATVVPPPASPGLSRPWFWAAALMFVTATGGGLLAELKAKTHVGAPGVTISVDPLAPGAAAGGRTNGVFLPINLPGFASLAAPMLDNEIATLPADTTFGRRGYRRLDGGFEAMGSVVLMGTDRTSIHRPEYCLTGVGWNVLGARPCSIPLAGGRTLHGTRLDLRRAGARPEDSPVSGIYVYWYVSRGSRASDMVRCQWASIKSLVLHAEMERWAYVSFLTVCPIGLEDQAFQNLAKLVAAAQPDIESTPVEEVPPPFFQGWLTRAPQP